MNDTLPTQNTDAQPAGLPALPGSACSLCRGDGCEACMYEGREEARQRHMVAKAEVMPLMDALYGGAAPRWIEHTECGIKVSTWTAAPSVCYHVIKDGRWFKPFITTGTTHKMMRALGDDGVSSLEESAARYACELHWRNTPTEERP